MPTAMQRASGTPTQSMAPFGRYNSVSSPLARSVVSTSNLFRLEGRRAVPQLIRGHGWTRVQASTRFTSLMAMSFTCFETVRTASYTPSSRPKGYNFFLFSLCFLSRSLPLVLLPSFSTLPRPLSLSLHLSLSRTFSVSFSLSLTLSLSHTHTLLLSQTLPPSFPLFLFLFSSLSRSRSFLLSLSFTLLLSLIVLLFLSFSLSLSLYLALFFPVLVLQCQSLFQCLPAAHAHSLFPDSPSSSLSPPLPFCLSLFLFLPLSLSGSF